MRRIVTLICLVVFGVLCLINYTLPADAAKKGKSKVNTAQIQKLNEDTDLLTRKFYTRELYSPQDSDNLINLKLQLDNLMNEVAEPSYAPIYFKLGKLYKLRGMEKEAIDCFKTILENFSDTAYAPKAREVLLEMGVEIQESELQFGEDEESEEF